MPVPGPRNQFGPDPGYRNPELEQPSRFNHWDRPGPIRMAGRTPGTMIMSLRGNILGPGQIRRLWRQSVNLMPAQAAMSWSTNSPSPDRPGLHYPAVGITRALRYMTRSVYMGAGIDNSRFAGLHTVVKKRHFAKHVTINAGQVRSRPTVRNRVSSFGSRVPTLNSPVPAAQQSGQSR